VNQGNLWTAPQDDSQVDGESTLEEFLANSAPTVLEPILGDLWTTLPVFGGGYPDEDHDEQ
jgi:hypothetical protein